MDQEANMTATLSDVNNGAQSKTDVYPCTKCQKHCNTGNKCNNCSMWTHHLCSEMPAYYLVVLTNSNRRYTCLTCAKQNYPDFNSQAEEIDEIKQNEETHNSLLDSQLPNLVITQSTGEGESTGPNERTEVEDGNNNNREVFGSSNSPRICP